MVLKAFSRLSSSADSCFISTLRSSAIVVQSLFLESERMVEMAKLYSKGEEVFGTIDNFKEWMNTTLLPLGNKKPKEFLDTSLGINMLMNELGRIQHGIFA